MPILQGCFLCISSHLGKFDFYCRYCPIFFCIILAFRIDLIWTADIVQYFWASFGLLKLFLFWLRILENIFHIFGLFGEFWVWLPTLSMLRWNCHFRQSKKAISAPGAKKPTRVAEFKNNLQRRDTELAILKSVSKKGSISKVWTSFIRFKPIYSKRNRIIFIRSFTVLTTSGNERSEISSNKNDLWSPKVNVRWHWHLTVET